jgi:hypothetical protein
LRQVNGLAKNHAVSGFPFNSCMWTGVMLRGPDAWGSYEQTGYLIDGLERLSLLTNDPTITNDAQTNIRYILDHPQPDGTLGLAEIGPYQWPRNVVFRSIMAAYTAHPDPAILTALRQHFLARPADFGAGRDACNIEPMLFTYAHTNDPQLLQIAQRTYDNFNHGNPPTSLSKLADDSKISEHGVTFNETAKLPALLYCYTGNHALLDASINAYRKIDRDHMLASGIHSSCEGLIGKDPFSYAETCNVSDYTWSVGYLLMASGDATWADHIERAVFNAGLGAITKDFKAFQYFSAPNQIFAIHGGTRSFNPAYDSNRDAYRPGHDVQCCTGNVERFLPNFALRQWMLTPDGSGVVAAMYSPSQFTATVGGADHPQKITIDEQTAYPFDETIAFVIHSTAPTDFAFNFRIPGWCESPNVDLNGQPQHISLQPGTFAAMHRTFTDGDRIELHLPMSVKIVQWANNTASIERGPLVYSLKIDESSTPEFGPMTSHDFPAWDKRPTSTWNDALAINPTDRSAVANIKIIQQPKPGVPWDIGNAPIALQVPVVRINNWTTDAHGLVQAFPKSYDFAQTTETATFVPYGATCLRLTVLPVSSRN